MIQRARGNRSRVSEQLNTNLSGGWRNTMSVWWYDIGACEFTYYLGSTQFCVTIARIAPLPTTSFHSRDFVAVRYPKISENQRNEDVYTLLLQLVQEPSSGKLPLFFRNKPHVHSVFAREPLLHRMISFLNNNYPSHAKHCTNKQGNAVRKIRKTETSLNRFDMVEKVRLKFCRPILKLTKIRAGQKWP